MTRKRRPVSRRGQRGFTLIEVVVAFAILALTLTALYESYGWTLRRSGELRRKELALLTAQSILSRMRADGSLRLGHQTGTTAEGILWTAEVVLYPAAVDPQSRLKAYQVTISTHWGASQKASAGLTSIEWGYASS